jgi:myo-inositol-1(or 4)-monophosphatase
LPGPEATADRYADLALVVDAAREAGEIALRYFRHSPKSWTKSGESPVTEADIEADRFLFQRLRDARPDYGWLSEETIDTPERLTRRRIFVVDPIDGTRGFIEGNPDWCVSVAIVEDGVSIAAALAVPARAEWFEATAGGGARLNGVALGTLGGVVPGPLRFAGPARHMRALDAAGLAVAERRATPSLAYRFALVAAGRIDLATATPNASDWDLAASDLLVHEAGGKLCTAQGAAVRYNRPELRHSALLAGTAELVALAGPVVEKAEHR